MQQPSALPPSQPENVFHAILRALQFDLEQLQQLSDHSLEFEQELLQLYLDDQQAQLKLLQQAVGAEDWPQVQQKTHYIKGASASVGAVRLSQLAEAIEQQAKLQTQHQTQPQTQHQTGSAQDLLSELACEFERLEQQIAPALPNWAELNPSN